jgi:hypothetical protein
MLCYKGSLDQDRLGTNTGKLKRDADFSHAPGALLGVWLKSMLNCSGMSNAQGGL